MTAINDDDDDHDYDAMERHGNRLGAPRTGTGSEQTMTAVSLVSCDGKTYDIIIFS